MSQNEIIKEILEGVQTTSLFRNILVSKSVPKDKVVVVAPRQSGKSFLWDAIKLTWRRMRWENRAELHRQKEYWIV